MKHPENLTDLSFFGSRIREARKKAGLSQHALAERLGVSRNTVVNWESGRCTTDYQTTLAVCEALGAGPDLLLPPQPGEAQSGVLSADEQRLLQLYRQLSPDERLRAEALLSALSAGAAPARGAASVLTDGAASAAAGQTAVSAADAAEAASAARPATGAAVHSAAGRPVQEPVDGSLFRLFAEYPGAAAAGTGTEFADTRPEPLILRRSPRNVRADALVRVSGDSMEPVYHDGDYLYFRFSDTARSGADVVCSTIHGTIVKRMGADGLFSVNPERPFRMKTEADNVRLLGVVTGLAESEDWPSRDERNVLQEQFHEEEKDFRRKYRLEDWE